MCDDIGAVLEFFDETLREEILKVRILKIFS